MARLSKSCIFCGNYKDITNEHIVPDWISQIIPKGPRDRRLFTLERSLEGGARLKSQRIFSGHPISKRVKVVCKRCNTGWMAELEQELKPTITKMILGEFLTLNSWAQRRLALWAVKTAMTAEYTDPKSVALTFAQREYLRLHREPPKDFDVWAALYLGKKHKAMMNHHSGHFSISDPSGIKRPAPPNTQFTTIGLGKLFLHVSYIGITGARFKHHDERISNFRQIWPPLDREISWPPPAALEDAQLIALEASLRREFHGTA